VGEEGEKRPLPAAPPLGPNVVRGIRSPHGRHHGSPCPPAGNNSPMTIRAWPAISHRQRRRTRASRPTNETVTLDQLCQARTGHLR
jgi:hypothetical protein